MINLEKIIEEYKSNKTDKRPNLIKVMFIASIVFSLLIVLASLEQKNRFDQSFSHSFYYSSMKIIGCSDVGYKYYPIVCEPYYAGSKATRQIPVYLPAILGLLVFDTLSLITLLLLASKKIIYRALGLSLIVYFLLIVTVFVLFNIPKHMIISNFFGDLVTYISGYVACVFSCNFLFFPFSTSIIPIGFFWVIIYSILNRRAIKQIS